MPYNDDVDECRCDASECYCGRSRSILKPLAPGVYPVPTISEAQQYAWWRPYDPHECCHHHCGCRTWTDTKITIHPGNHTVTP